MFIWALVFDLQPMFDRLLRPLKTPDLFFSLSFSFLFKLLDLRNGLKYLFCPYNNLIIYRGFWPLG